MTQVARQQSQTGPAIVGKISSGSAPLINFVRELRSEIRKVTWPTRREATNLTIIVVLVSAAVGVVLGGFDFLFSEAFTRLVR